MKAMLGCVNKYLYQGTCGIAFFFLLSLLYGMACPIGPINMDSILGRLMVIAFLFVLSGIEIYKIKANQYPLKYNLFAVWIGFWVGAALPPVPNGWICFPSIIFISIVLMKVLDKRKV